MNGKDGRHAEDIVAHIEKHIGRVAQVFQENGADGPRVLVHHVPATADRPFHTLVTSGMSDSAMAVPAQLDAPRHLELMMTLPKDWQFDAASARDANWHWPVKQLQRLARVPIESGAWLGWGHTVPNGDPPQAFAPGTGLCGVIIAPSLLVPVDFYELHTTDQAITFYSAIPLYREEMDLQLEHGMAALLGRLLDHGIRDLIDPHRRNVARKKILGLF
jgi:hypothetical protein